MGQSNNMSILMVIALAAAIIHSSDAADHIVGGSTGWTDSPPGGASFYSNWASNITFRQNDVLVFNFVAGIHTVAELTKANYDSCAVGQSILVVATSPARLLLNRTGQYYFSCTSQGHCGNGQKLSVNVAGSSPTPRNSPPPRSAPPPAQSPPTSGTTPSPPSNGEAPPPSSTNVPGATPPTPGSATTLIATYSLLSITIVINILF